MASHDCQREGQPHRWRNPGAVAPACALRQHAGREADRHRAQKFGVSCEALGGLCGILGGTWEGLRGDQDGKSKNKASPGLLYLGKMYFFRKGAGEPLLFLFRFLFLASLFRSLSLSLNV